MCSGAMLHARLKRVVFGAFDPKTGAAGSVVNLFAQPQLNHQTAWQGGVMAADSAALLQGFFKQRRAAQRDAAKTCPPLRDDALRTPDSAFSSLPDYPWSPHYISDLPALGGLRLHYLDAGAHETTAAPAPAGQLTYLCLHGSPAWSYLYRKMMPVFQQAGHRVLAPDLIGFGKSDKPKKGSFHSFSTHRRILLELVERLDLHNVVLVVQDCSEGSGRADTLGLTLPMAAPQRYRGIVVLNNMSATRHKPWPAGCVAWREVCTQTGGIGGGQAVRLFARGKQPLSAAERAAYNAPFPDAGHRSGTRAFPVMVPGTPDANGAAVSRQALNFWQHQWAGQSLLAECAQDPEPRLCASPPVAVVLAQGTDLAQAHGQAIAQWAVQHFQNVTPEKK